MPVSAAATLPNFIHPFDAAVTDLVVHAIAVGLVVLGDPVLWRRALADSISNEDVTDAPCPESTAAMTVAPACKQKER